MKCQRRHRRFAAAAAAALILLPAAAPGARAKIPTVAKDPYLSALVLNAGTGEVFFEDNSAAPAYPASVIKLMMLLILQEKIEEGTLRLDDPVTVTAAAARTGGSQVYLKEGEVFSVEDLLYSLIVHSANDSAVALAVHTAGSPEAFVELMNLKAAELGMADTVFHSVHGLPPAAGDEPDVSTARDLVRLALELIKHPAVFDYTKTTYRPFRDGTFDLRTHNHLLGSVPGCDGFKTGYFKTAGFSIVATASRRGVRFVAVVLGAKDRNTRDAKARELLTKAFSSTVLPAVTPRFRPSPPPTPAGAAADDEEVDDRTEPEENAETGNGSGSLALKLTAMLAVAGVFFWLGSRRSR